MLMFHTCEPLAPFLRWIGPDEYWFVHGSLPATNLLTQTMGSVPAFTLFGLMLSAVAAAWAALYSSCGSVLKMAAVRPPARDDCETSELVLNAKPNSMMPKVRSTSSGRIMANSTMA